MFLSQIYNTLNHSMQELAISQILEWNEKSMEHGLALSFEEAKQMLLARYQILEHYSRVELSLEVTRELIEVFSESSFINQEIYAQTLNEMHEIFYYLKNETEDRISDVQVVEVMKNFFEEECEGSLELLRSKAEEYAEDFRRDIQIKEAMTSEDDV